MQKRSIATTFVAAMVAAAALSILLTGGIWLRGQYLRMDQEVETLRSDYLEERKRIVRSYAERASEFIAIRSRQEKRINRNHLRAKTTENRKLLDALIHNTKGALSPSQLRLLAARLLNASAEPPLFTTVLGPENKTILNPADPLLEGMGLSEVFPAITREIELAVRSAASSPDRQAWLKSSHGRQRLMLVQHYPPLGWTIITHVFTGPDSQEARDSILGRLSRVSFEEHGRLMVVGTDGNVILHDGEKHDHHSFVWSLPGLNGLQALWPEKGEYRPEGIRMVLLQAPDSEDTRLVAFKLIPEWNWIIFADLPMGDLASRLAFKEGEVKSQIQREILRTSILLALFLATLLFLGRLVSRRIQRSVNGLLAFFDRAGSEPVHIDRNLSPYTEFQRLADAANQMVDEREAAYAALKEGEQRYRATFESAAMGMAHVSAQGRWLSVNDRLCEMLGRSRESLLASDTTLGLAPGEADGILNCCRAFETGSDSRSVFEQRYTMPDGSLAHFRMTASPVHDAWSTVSYCVLIVEDIGEQKRVETALRKAKEAAESSDRAKSEFLANMSHELRTPLNGVLGMLQLLEETELDTEQEENVRLALQSGRSLLSIIGDVLDLSKMEAGMLGLNHDPIQVVPMLKGIQESFVVLANEKGLDLTLNAGDSIPPLLLGDEMRIKQILFNLLGNALKFTESGGVSITAEAVAHPGRADMVTLLMTVSDTGIGIPEEMIDSVFDDFRQIDGSHTRKHQGTGLGLGIVKRLIGLMGGHITVCSEPGKGTEITVAIQLEKVAARDMRHRAVTVSVQDLPGLNILVVEDEPVNARALVRLLQKAGNTAVTAENGEEALARLREQPFDLVLMDIQMPVMDGLEATRTLRNDPTMADGASTPVIALTAHAMAGDRESFLAAGMDGYVAKPLDRNELFRVIAEVVSGGR